MSKMLRVVRSFKLRNLPVDLLHSNLHRFWIEWQLYQLTWQHRRDHYTLELVWRADKSRNIFVFDEELGTYEQYLLYGDIPPKARIRFLWMYVESLFMSTLLWVKRLLKGRQV